ncbi:MAG TPA: hypothetical protein VNK23_12825 [Candidatus Dormibacteraeota bacterium]|nr:hypothetical protein [Candidatus Dormibacteraeota bacterium]
MSETATSSIETPSGGGAEKRRSTRLVRAVPIIVVGTDALGQPFRESTSTMMVDCYGCKFQSRNYAPKHSTVMVEIFHAPGWDRRVVQGRVVWVQRPRTHRENYQIAIALEVPGNVWGVSPPPADWFAHPDDHAPAPIEVSDPGPIDASNFAPADTEQQANAGTEAALEALSSSNDAEAVEIETQPIGDDAEDIGPAIEEFTFTREHLDGQIHEAIGKTLRSMIERAAEAAVRDLLEDVSERTAALVEAARRISEEAAQEVDAKLRSVLDETVKSLQIELPKPANHKRRRRGGR